VESSELNSIRSRLEQVMDADYIDAWLASPVPALDGERPIDLIKRGEGIEVSRLVSSLEGMLVV
jgi:uncharacterized protein (DUF2384 family)